MRQILKNELILRLSTFLLLVLAVQMIHGLMGLPYYDLIYLLVIMGLLLLGDYLPRLRWVFFAGALFLIDLSPGFVLLPLALFYVFIRNISPKTLVNQKTQCYKQVKFSAKTGI